MGLSGKYDFKGIQKVGGAGIRVLLSKWPWTAWLTRLKSFNSLLNFGTNWLANHGLIILNVGANTIDGELDQRAFDSAFSKAIEEIKIKGGREKLTPAQIKAIDDEVIKAGRRHIVIGKPN